MDDHSGSFLGCHYHTEAVDVEMLHARAIGRTPKAISRYSLATSFSFLIGNFLPFLFNCRPPHIFLGAVYHVRQGG